MYPMYPAYQERCASELLRRLETYSRRYGLVAVLIRGSRFHPTSSTSCGCAGGRGCRPEEIVHKQWILPHKERFRPCEAAGKYVNFHEATLRDVERVSGLTLFAGQLASQPDSAHGSHARFITQLPELRPPLTWSN
ncbi:uncharacterized protein LOC119100845 [Pollicipes pollicipes]|uniref:uncharacterized protein LOC119100845 n=1 Tax=Pollicipes pollicipes TaxID=41117 RepID=UPI0018855B30|nr:uncharacterized protein LOC119100845 [Pollicipes pollicipes]